METLFETTNITEGACRMAHRSRNLRYLTENIYLSSCIQTKFFYSSIEYIWKVSIIKKGNSWIILKKRRKNSTERWKILIIFDEEIEFVHFHLHSILIICKRTLLYSLFKWSSTWSLSLICFFLLLLSLLSFPLHSEKHTIKILFTYT